MDFKSLSTVEHEQLRTALLNNAHADKAMMMDRCTSYIGTTDEVRDDDVVNAVKSIPCHY